MADLEKTINDLVEIEANMTFYKHPESAKVVRDAIELLKEYQKTVHCKDCKWSWCLNPNDESPFYVCRHPTLCNMRMSHEGNWYCGDGELKDGEQE